MTAPLRKIENFLNAPVEIPRDFVRQRQRRRVFARLDRRDRLPRRADRTGQLLLRNAPVRAQLANKRIDGLSLLSRPLVI